VVEVGTEEQDEFSSGRIDVQMVIAQIKPQRAAVAFLPIVVEIENAR
jgi:hypothetical protein